MARKRFDMKLVVVVCIILLVVAAIEGHSNKNRRPPPPPPPPKQSKSIPHHIVIRKKTRIVVVIIFFFYFYSTMFRKSGILSSSISCFVCRHECCLFLLNHVIYLFIWCLWPRLCAVDLGMTASPINSVEDQSLVSLNVRTTYWIFFFLPQFKVKDLELHSIGVFCRCFEESKTIQNQIENKKTKAFTWLRALDVVNGSLLYHLISR